MLKLLLSVLGATVLSSACTSIGVTQVPATLQTGQFEITQAPALYTNGRAADLLYYDPENQLMLRSGSGGEQMLSDPLEKDVRRSYVELHSDGPWRYAMWRPKLSKAIEGVGIPGDKLVYVRSSPDGGKTFGPTQRLNQKGGAFKPFMASNGRGDVYVAYTDERLGGNLNIFLNVSHDHGQTWKKEDYKLTGTESQMAVDPSVVADGDHVYVSWMTTDAAKKFNVFVRASADRGETWAPPVAAHISEIQPATPLLINTAVGPLLCWGDIDAVRCTTSSDHARSWAPSIPVADSKGTAGLQLAMDPKGRVHLLFAKRPEEEKTKLNLFHAESVGGAPFSQPVRLSGGEPYTASTILPTMAFGDDGSALVAWVDMRYHRPVIAANYSRDGGATWLSDSVVLAGRKGMYHFFPTVAWAGEGVYSVAWQESDNRSNPVTTLGRTEYRVGAPGVAMSIPDAARLKQRVDAFWSVREENKWAEAYNYLDPFYREKTPQDVYAKSQGNVKYYGHRIAGEPEISGTRATVPLAYDSEVPEMSIRGKKIVVPRVEVTIPQEWIWVDGDWYQVLRDVMGGSSLLD